MCFPKKEIHQGQRYYRETPHEKVTEQIRKPVHRSVAFWLTHQRQRGWWVRAGCNASGALFNGLTDFKNIWVLAVSSLVLPIPILRRYRPLFFGVNLVLIHCVLPVTRPTLSVIAPIFPKNDDFFNGRLVVSRAEKGLFNTTTVLYCLQSLRAPCCTGRNDEKSKYKRPTWQNRFVTRLRHEALGGKGREASVEGVDRHLKILVLTVDMIVELRASTESALYKYSEHSK